VSARPLTLAMTLTLLAACGGSPDPALSGFEHREAAEPAVPAEPPPPPPRVRELSIARAELDAALDAGPGRFLGTFEIRARVVGGRFAGWEIVRAPWDTLDLLPGDLVRRVNRRTMERPLELESLWGELRTADALELEVERGGEVFALRIAIAGGAPPAP
jgi:hypothetical protein